MTRTGPSISVEAFAQRLPSSTSIFTVTYDEGAASSWRDWLSDDEKSCIASFGAESRRREFLAGRAAARILLARELDVEPSVVPLQRGEDDAVDVVRGDWHVSIAHSGPHAVAACAQHPLGVDLERIKPRDPAIRRFLFAPDERDMVEQLPYDDDAALILCWTLKEAVLKGQRTGFRTSPKDVHLRVDSGEERGRADVEGRGAWSIYYTRAEDYWSAVAVPAR